MKRKIARLLVKLAQKLNPSVAFENAPFARPMGITLHITKNDIRKWLKEHPDCKSYRQGMNQLIKEARWQVAGSIGRGMMKNDAIDFDIRKTLYVADVSGTVYLYTYHEDNGTDSSEGTGE